MFKRRTRRTLGLETLESRQVLSGGGPSAAAQYMLEQVNLARTDPAAAAQQVTSNLSFNDQLTLKYYNVDINQVKNIIASSTPQPPLAWSPQLAASAQRESQDMINTGIETHFGPNGSTPQSRMTDAGYTNQSSSGENAYAYATSVDQAMKAFLIDWGVADSGHRRNILQPGTAANQAYRDVGISILNSTNSKVGPLVITQDFGAQNGEQAQLVGVAFNDPNNTQTFAEGSGQGGVTINAVNRQTGQTSSTQTWAAGGYQMPLSPGTYQVTAVLNGQVVGSNQVTVGNVNVQLNFDLNNPPPAAVAPQTSIAAPQAQMIAPVTLTQSWTPAQIAPVAPVVNAAAQTTASTPTPTPAPSTPVVNVQIPTNAVTTPISTQASTPATPSLSPPKFNAVASPSIIPTNTGVQWQWNSWSANVASGVN